MAGEAFFKAGGLAPLPPEDPPRRGETAAGSPPARQGDELVAAAVLGQGAPVAIQNPAPRGNERAAGRSGSFRQQAVPLAVLGLQAMEAGGESPGDGELGPGEKDDAAGKAAGLAPLQIAGPGDGTRAQGAAFHGRHLFLVTRRAPAHRRCISWARALGALSVHLKTPGPRRVRTPGSQTRLNVPPRRGRGGGRQRGRRRRSQAKARRERRRPPPSCRSEKGSAQNRRAAAPGSGGGSRQPAQSKDRAVQREDRRPDAAKARAKSAPWSPSGAP